MVKTKTKRSRRYSSMPKIPISVIVGLLPTFNEAKKGWQETGFQGMTSNVSAALTGYSLNTNKWYGNSLKYGLFPLVLGIGTHMLATYAGVNRALGRAKIPFIRI